MTWKEIEQNLDNGKKQIVFVTKPLDICFRVYNYSTNSTVNTMLSLLDIWGLGQVVLSFIKRNLSLKVMRLIEKYMISSVLVLCKSSLKGLR